MVRLENCNELFAQQLFKVWSICYSPCLNSNSRWFKCNLEENSNANVNLNKTDNEVLISTSVKPIINWSYYSSLTKISGMDIETKKELDSLEKTQGRQRGLKETKSS